MDEIGINAKEDLNPTQGINNRLYWGNIGPFWKGVIIVVLLSLAAVATFRVENIIWKIIIFTVMGIGLIYALLMPLIVLPKRRNGHLVSIKEEYGGETMEPEERSRGFSSYVVWAGDYKGYPCEIEETFEGPRKKGVYHNIYKVKMEVHKQFELRKADLKHDFGNPDLISIIGIKFILRSRNHKNLITDWFFEDDKRTAKIVYFLEFMGDADIQGRWISIGVRSDNVTLVRSDFQTKHLSLIFDYLIHLGSELKELKSVKQMGGKPKMF